MSNDTDNEGLSREEIESERQLDSAVEKSLSSLYRRRWLATIERLERELGAYREHNDTNDKRIARLQQDLSDAYARDRGEVWYWQGDGTDEPESLSCPVQMPAETLRGMLKQLAEAQAEVARLTAEIEQAKEYIRHADPTGREFSDTDFLHVWIHHFGMDMDRQDDTVIEQLRKEVARLTGEAETTGYLLEAAAKRLVPKMEQAEERVRQLEELFECALKRLSLYRALLQDIELSDGWHLAKGLSERINAAVNAGPLTEPPSTAGDGDAEG